VLSGVSLRQIAREWNAAGLRTSFGGRVFSSREVRKILLRPRNAGISLHEGKRIAGAEWQPIIDAETFSALDALLRNPERSQHISYERKHMGSGVYVCGKCGAQMMSAAHNRSAGGWRPVYVCSVARHLGRDIGHVDELVSEVVIERLSHSDAAIVLGGGPDIDLGALHNRREGYRVRLDELGALFAEGAIDAQQLKRATAQLRAKLDAVDAEIAAARSSSALANLVLAGDDLRATWEATSADVRGKIIDALMTVTILPAGPGRRPGGFYFDPDTVRIDWKVTA
jgi:site-specific DNA recombinase